MTAAGALTGGGEGGRRVAGGAACCIGERNAVAEGVGGAVGEGWGERISERGKVVAVCGGVEGESDLSGRDGYAGLVVEFAAKGSVDRGAAEWKLVGGLSGEGETQLDGVTDAGDGEVADGFGEIEGGGPGEARGGATDGGEQRKENPWERRPEGTQATWAQRRVHGESVASDRRRPTRWVSP